MNEQNNNAECSICGKAYHVCVSCKDEMSATPWKVHTDTSEHFKVFQIVRGYSTGVYNKEEAKARFERVDLSDIGSFRPNIKSIIKGILKENKRVVSDSVKKVNERVVVATDETETEKPE